MTDLATLPPTHRSLRGSAAVSVSCGVDGTPQALLWRVAISAAAALRLTVDSGIVTVDADVTAADRAPCRVEALLDEAGPGSFSVHTNRWALRFIGDGECTWLMFDSQPGRVHVGFGIVAATAGRDVAIAAARLVDGREPPPLDVEQGRSELVR